MKKVFRKKIINWISGVALLLGLILGGTFLWKENLFVNADEPEKVVRVGYIGYEGFINKKENGQMVGYGVEYLNEIAKYTNYEYEYVRCTWAESLEMLSNKEIDLVCTAFYSEERAEVYEFSDQNFGRVRGVLYTTKDNEEIYYEDFEHFEGMVVGVLDGTLNGELFADYAKKNHFNYTEKPYATEAEMVEALQKGEIDAIATEQTSIHNQLKLVGVYGSQLYYLITYKGNDIMDDIDAAMMDIYMVNHKYESELYEKYYGEANRIHALCLTREEAAYIAEGREIVVGQKPNLFPLSYYDEETGELKGIYIDIANRIAEISGLKIKQIPLDEGMSPAQALSRNGYVTVVMSAVEGSLADAQRVKYTESYMDASMGIVAKKGFDYNFEEPQRVAVQETFLSMIRYLEENYPSSEVVTCATDDECVRAVANGEADIMIQNVYVINYLLQKPRYRNLEMVPLDNMLVNNAFVLKEDESAILVSILNKSIQYLAEEEVNEIVIRNTTGNLYEYTWEDVWSIYGKQIVMIVVLSLLCLVLLSVLTITRQRNLAIVKRNNILLRAAMEQAMSANKAKSEFLARMSHEIRTPMNAIVNITGITKKVVNDPEKVEESLGKIEASSKVLLTLINDILDMSAIESNKIRIAEAEFSVHEVLDNIVTIYGTQCKNKGIDFSLDMDLEEEKVLGDSLRLSQILLNLVSNAYKFTASGGAIKIGVYPIGSHDNVINVRFSVADTGEGMSEEMLGRLFLPFEQESSLTAQKHGGSGLGLSIAKNLVDLMGGQITVESKQGVGTTFIVDLPFLKIPKEQEDAGAFDLSALDFGGKKILLADDNEMNRDIATDLLEMVNLETISVCNGKEAVEVFATSKPGEYQVILMDIQMPEMNGYEATRQIRRLEHPQALNIPIIAMTANAFTEDINAAMSAGMNGHVAKPIDTEVLYKILWKYINE